MASSCKHLARPSATVTARLLDPTRWRCDTCHSTDGVWVCLGCGFAGCSREATSSVGGGHALHHHVTVTEAQCKGSCVLDVVSQHCHCYECDDYVIDTPAWLSVLRSKIEGLEPAPPPVGEGDDDGGDGNMPTPDAPPPIAPPGHCGLANLGNTCYMNSSMQLLASLSGFRSFFHDFLKASVAHAPLQVGSVGLVRQPTSQYVAQLEAKGKPETFQLVHAVHGLLRVLRAGRCRSVRPQLLVQSVWRHAGLFAPYVQCCASEFLTYVLDRLTPSTNQ